MADDEQTTKFDKEIEEMGLEPSTFEELERDFQEVLREMSKDKQLERFRLEYEKLHRALRTSHESEKKLIKKCKELNHQIINNASKIQTALKLSKDDAHTISVLRKELEKTYKLVESGREKEDHYKQQIQNMKSQMDEMKTIVEQGNQLTIGEGNNLEQMIQEKHRIEEEKNLKEAQVIKIQQD